LTEGHSVHLNDSIHELENEPEPLKDFEATLTAWDEAARMLWQIERSDRDRQSTITIGKPV
jgi:hypothetical protein